MDRPVAGSGPPVGWDLLYSSPESSRNPPDRAFLFGAWVMTSGTEEHRKPVRLAGAALRYAIEQDWPKASQMVGRLNAECGAEGLGDALVAWCDTFAAHATDGEREFQKVKLAHWNVETGSLKDQIPERVKWAHRLIEARASGDLDAFLAQLKHLNNIADGYERGRYVSALLEGISLTIRSLPRGYAKRLAGGES